MSRKMEEVPIGVDRAPRKHVAQSDIGSQYGWWETYYAGVGVDLRHHHRRHHQINHHHRHHYHHQHHHHRLYVCHHCFALGVYHTVMPKERLDACVGAHSITESSHQAFPPPHALPKRIATPIFHPTHHHQARIDPPDFHAMVRAARADDGTKRS